MTVIFHIAQKREWDKSLRQGRYETPSLAQEGFIHCSTSGQIINTANNLFRGKTNLVLLKIDSGKLNAPVVYENLEGGSDKFPHIYGPLNLDAVIEAVTFAPDKNGNFNYVP